MTHPVLTFPVLEGMSYPQLTERNLIRTINDREALLALSEAERFDVQVLMTSASRGCDVHMIQALPNLQLVVSQGAGQDKLDITAMEGRGIQLRSVGETVAEDVADLAMALTQMMFRDLLRADAFVRSGAWERHRFNVGDSVAGKTMGIAGLSGRIGQALAARATVSGMKIAGLTRRSNQGLDAKLYDGWEAMSRACDVLVLAVPGTADLHHVVNSRVLAALGPQGRLVNVGRGSLVDTAALLTALESGAIAGAALDVLEEEPKIPPQLAAMGNVILTPHIGAQTWGQRARAARIAEAEVLKSLNGRHRSNRAAPR